MPPLSWLEDLSLKRKILDDTVSYSLRTFARIRYHYFSKYWRNGCMGRPPTSNFGGRPPSTPRAPPMITIIISIIQIIVNINIRRRQSAYPHTDVFSRCLIFTPFLSPPFFTFLLLLSSSIPLLASIRTFLAAYTEGLCIVSESGLLVGRSIGRPLRADLSSSRF